MSDREIQKRLVDEAKQCQTTNGAAMLLAVKHWLDGTELWDEPEELHETADRLCGQQTLTL